MLLEQQKLCSAETLDIVGHLRVRLPGGGE
jgi:hypothetical protein